MNIPRSTVCLAPLAPSRTPVHPPCVLLCGQHQPTLLRCLDGWPRRHGKATALSIHFAEPGQSLAAYADDRFDLAVVQAPPAAEAQQLIQHLVRIARQGLLRLNSRP